MKLLEMAKYHNQEAQIKALVEVCNDSSYIVKIPDPYDNRLNIVGSASYVDEAEIKKHYDEGDEPFVAVSFVNEDDSDIFGPEEFVEMAQVFELKRVK